MLRIVILLRINTDENCYIDYNSYRVPNCDIA